jgi:methionyl-tRNA formyltransferase
MDSPLRIVFMGTPDLARTVLRTLAANPLYLIPLVVSQPDRPKGRDLKLLPTPVKELALELGIPIAQPEKARQADFQEKLRQLKPDLIVVAAYGQILPQAILDIPRYGCINVHTSILPSYRGAAPIQRAILNGESQTGVTIMRMDAGLDTGDILTVESTPITPQDTSASLHDRLAEIGAALLDRTLPEWVSGSIKPTPQNHQMATLAPKIRKEEGCIKWTLPAARIVNLVRGSVPWPGAFTHLSADPRPVLLKVWQAEICTQSGPPGTVLSFGKDGIVVGCGTGSVRLINLQREGSRRLGAGDFLAGCPLPVGTTFHQVTTDSLARSVKS